MTDKIKYRVATFRDAGLEAKWSKTRAGAPIIVARSNAESKWFYVDVSMFKSMRADGVVEGFEQHTCLGDIFYI